MAALRVAWRNIRRHRGRTGITVIAVTVNTAVIIMGFALMEGVSKQLADNITQISMGDAQVHAEGFREDRSFYTAIKSPERVIAAARAAGIDASPRSYGSGLVALGNRSAGATFWGVDPRAELTTFSLAGRIANGAFLTPTARGDIILGSKLAKALRVEVGSELVALVQAADGSLGNALFEVAGILKAAGADIDRGAAIMHQADFEKLFLAGGRVHEIALNTHGKIPTEGIAASIGAIGPGNELKTWRQLLPAMSEMMKFSGVLVWMVSMMFYLTAGFGVMNTMLMATHDRVREYGVIKALGATPWRIVRDVATEAWMLALVSTAVGAVLGVLGSFYLQEVGINLESRGTELTVMGVAADPILRGTFAPQEMVLSVLIMWVICILASLHPAIKASRLEAVSAMTHV